MKADLVQLSGEGRTDVTLHISQTRRYMQAFVYSLRATGHSARNVKAVLREFADMVIATMRDERPEPYPGQQWKTGDEYLPFHPSASHVDPSYRDGWNACYVAARDDRERHSGVTTTPAADTEGHSQMKEAP